MSAAFLSDQYFEFISKISLQCKSSSEYEKVLDILFDCWKNGGIVYCMGCGGSASTASHFAADLAKTTIVEDKPRFKSLSLVDTAPLVSAWTNDSGWGTIFAEQIRPWVTSKDVLVGFSVHGGSGQGEAGPWSQNLVAAMKLAKEKGAKVVGFAGFDGGAMKEMADACLIVPVEVEEYGTPLVEGFHGVLSHGIIFALKERMKNATV